MHDDSNAMEAGPVEFTGDLAAFRTFERDGWRRAAERYRMAWTRLTSQAFEPLLDATGVGADTRLLELASGPGAPRRGGRGRPVSTSRPTWWRSRGATI